MWSERIIKICFFSGVAPVYKPGNLATGQYPQNDAGYLASDRATVFCEYSVFPNYERYTNDEQARYDMLYELKVAATAGPSARWCGPPSERFSAPDQGNPYFPSFCHQRNPLPGRAVRSPSSPRRQRGYSSHGQWQKLPVPG
jgi:hypothetical protein